MEWGMEGGQQARSAFNGWCVKSVINGSVVGGSVVGGLGLGRNPTLVAVCCRRRPGGVHRVQQQGDAQAQSGHQEGETRRLSEALSRSQGAERNNYVMIMHC